VEPKLNWMTVERLRHKHKPSEEVLGSLTGTRATRSFNPRRATPRARKHRADSAAMHHPI